MKIGVIRETVDGERRVALVPESVRRLVRSGLEVVVQAGAGEQAGGADAQYAESGAALENDPQAVISACDFLVKVRRPSAAEAAGLGKGKLLVALMEAESHAELIQTLAAQQVTVLALERVPRIARAQSMDVLSSMSTVAGYKAVLMAADALPRFFPLLMTAAGTLPPARVLIIGAGVAGLQAIGSARRLGAKVEAFDPRPAAREQVESLGGKFVGAELLDAAVETAGGYAREQTEAERARQQEALSGAVAASNVIICSALVAGRKAPQIVNEVMVRSMQAGSVIVDLAAEQGGNCALTEAGSTVVRHGVTIIGPVNVPSLLAVDASRMFSRNMLNLLNHLIGKDGLVDVAVDEIARPCLVAHAGQAWSQGQPLEAASAVGGES